MDPLGCLTHYLLAVLFAVLAGGFDAALLLGQAVGIIVAALLIVFARP